MRIARFSFREKIEWGVLRENEIEFLSGSPFDDLRRTGEKRCLDEVRLLAPEQGGKVILAGLNYTDHAREMGLSVPGEPVIFLKPSSAVIGPGEEILIPPGAGRVDYEGELAMIVKTRARNIPREKAGEYILGYTCCNDVTARDLQEKDGQWSRAKSFDTFCPLGPWIETDINPGDLKIRTYLNGKLVQNSSTKNFIFSSYELLSFISEIMTLFPGDVISTGTPPGIGPMYSGDTVEIEIENIGRLINHVQ